MIAQFVEQLPGQFYEMINDMMFVPLMKESISMFSAGGPVFLYQLDYDKRGLEFIAPYHSMDLTYLVGIHNFTFDSRDIQIREIYSKLFAEFAKSGNPTPKGVTPQWLQLQKDSLFYVKDSIYLDSLFKTTLDFEIADWEYMERSYCSIKPV